MPFPFSHVCDLLQQVCDLPPARRNQPRAVNQLVYAWFHKHREAVDELSVPPESSDPKDPPKTKPKLNPAVALLSTLLPERRPDRVYGLQARGLQRILIRILGIGHSRVAELNRWERPVEYGDAVDLADCVEAILRITPNPATKKPVTVEEVDAVLDVVAARCRFSAPSIREDASAALVSSPTQAALGSLYLRLDARGAKWLTRLILKDFRPVVLDDGAITRAFHPSLPMALQVHSSLDAAVLSLQENSDDTSRQCKPLLGVKVGRQQWQKGRSIEHCVNMAGPHRMSCERKMDGEYVQLHVDLTTKSDRDCLQIFSKSGKDSTWDRVNVHGAIRDALRIGRADCKLTTGCILEGEMLAYDDRTGKILDFDAIRKHVNRRGTKIFNTKDETQDHEHLMMVWYDALLVDGESLLGMSHADRFRRLEELVDCRPGHSELVQREVIDFGSRGAASQLRQMFAKCISASLEGLVIKPDDDPYFDFADADTTKKRPFRSHCIKLKKEYIGTFGEVGDFAVIGARYDATKAMEYPPGTVPGRIRWTHFFIGCLDMAKSTKTRPFFVVTNVVTLTAAQMTTFHTHCRPRVVPFVLDAKQALADRKHCLPDCAFDFARIEPGIDGCKGGPTELFAEPPVMDIRCFSFHRQGYGRFWSPRFACVVKFHFDRTYLDVITYDALQDLGDEDSARRAACDDGEENENGNDDLVDLTLDTVDKNADEAHWVAQLKKADRRGIAVDAETSQSSGAATTERSQSSVSQLSMSSLPSARALACSQLHTQYTDTQTHNDLYEHDTHDTHNTHRLHEIHEMDETDTDQQTERETSVEADSQASEWVEKSPVKTPVKRSPAKQSPRRSAVSVGVKRQAVIDLTEDVGSAEQDAKEDEKRDAKDLTAQSGLYYDHYDSDYDSDASQQGIALLFAEEEARLSQLSQSFSQSYSQAYSQPTSQPSQPPATSPPSSFMSAPPPSSQQQQSMPSIDGQLGQLQSQSQPTTTQSQRPTQKRLRTWDVADMPSMSPISPPALKRARSSRV